MGRVLPLARSWAAMRVPLPAAEVIRSHVLLRGEVR